MRRDARDGEVKQDTHIRSPQGSRRLIDMPRHSLQSGSDFVNLLPTIFFHDQLVDQESGESENMGKEYTDALEQQRNDAASAIQRKHSECHDERWSDHGDGQQR